MASATNRRGTRALLALSAAALAVGMAASVGAQQAGAEPADGANAATPVALVTASALQFTRGLSASQAARAQRYQCMQDFRLCTRGISVSSSWSSKLAQQVYDAEYGSCCFEARLCGDFLESIGDRAIATDYRSDVDAACQAVTNTESAGAAGAIRKRALGERSSAPPPMR